MQDRSKMGQRQREEEERDKARQMRIEEHKYAVDLRDKERSEKRLQQHSYAADLLS